MWYAICLSFFIFDLFVEFTTASKNWRGCGKRVFFLEGICKNLCLVRWPNFNRVSGWRTEQNQCQLALNYHTSMISFKSLKISCIKNSDSCLRLLSLQSILVIVLTKAAPALFIKWRGEYFLKWLCIGNEMTVYWE